MLLSADVMASGLASGMGGDPSLMASADLFLPHESVQISDSAAPFSDAFLTYENGGQSSDLFAGISGEEMTLGGDDSDAETDANVSVDSSAGNAQNLDPISGGKVVAEPGVEKAQEGSPSSVSGEASDVSVSSTEGGL